MHWNSFIFRSTFQSFWDSTHTRALWAFNISLNLLKAKIYLRWWIHRNLLTFRVRFWNIGCTKFTRLSMTCFWCVLMSLNYQLRSSTSKLRTMGCRLFWKMLILFRKEKEIIPPKLIPWKPGSCITWELSCWVSLISVHRSLKSIGIYQNWKKNVSSRVFWMLSKVIQIMKNQ